MTVEIKVPQMGESVTEGIVARWLKAEGDAVEADEPLIEVETDKITVEVPAPSPGVLSKQAVQEGDTVSVGQILGEIAEGEGKPAKDTPKANGEKGEKDEKGEKGQKDTKQAKVDRSREDTDERANGKDNQSSAQARSSAPDESRGEANGSGKAREQSTGRGEVLAMPAARAEAGRRGMSLQSISGSGRGGRILKEDVVRAASTRESPAQGREPSTREERKPMSPLRRRVAERLVAAQQTAAILTTFNEVDMSATIAIRKKYRDSFQERHGVKLGFMSFFVKASVQALLEFPTVNAEIENDEIVYKYHYDIGVAVGGGKGLVVPVVRDVDTKGFAQIERDIADLGTRARDNKLKLEDLTGGTFTISNGGVYGSMLSTPILNPPQTGILGLHNIVERPVAIDGRVEVRPIMYLALSYDHRLVDGKEAVQFLVRIKQCIEDPERLLLEV